MIIENLKEEDIPQLLELYKTLLPFELSLIKSIKTYKEILSNEDYSLLVAKDDNIVIGSVLGIYCKALAVSFLVVEDVIIKDGLRGKGIGRKLMDALDDIAKSKQCSYAILVSSSHRKAAHKFYENTGFTDNVVGFRKIY